MTERERLEQSIAALVDAQRAVLGDGVVETALGPMQRQLVAPLLSVPVVSPW